MPQMPRNLRGSIAEPVHSRSEPEIHVEPATVTPAKAVVQGCGRLLRGQVISESMPHMVYTDGAGFLRTQE